MNKGKITQIIGAVIDVQFEKELPSISNALKLTNSGKELVLEVAQHIGGNQVRTIAMGATDGLQRNSEVTDTGSPIPVGVGKETLGRMCNALGQPINGNDTLKIAKTYQSQ